MYVKRVIPLANELKKNSILLLGPRRTGKSALISHELGGHKVYNLLHADVFQRLTVRPSLIRESLTKKDKLVVIDEIQKLPALMDEVHAMIEEFGTRFLLTGSSARKLKRTYTSLMAGRAKIRRLFPFVSAEISDFALERVLLTGLLPPVYLAEDPWEELSSYVGDYLKEEIKAEALSRNIENFSRFLQTAALAHTELLNFESIASDAQVAPRTIREYYNLLEDTLIGTLLEPFDSRGKRKAVSKGKFYFFDIGVVHQLIGRKSLPEGSADYACALEHFIFHELKAYLSYRRREETLRFWRTHGGYEVDFVVGDHTAIEIKCSRLITEKHTSGLRSLAEDVSLKRQIIVSQDKERRRLGKIEIFPIRVFLKALWSDAIF